MEGFLIALIIVPLYMGLQILILRLFAKLPIAKEFVFWCLVFAHLFLLPGLLVANPDAGAEPGPRCGMPYMAAMILRVIVSIIGTILFLVAHSIYRSQEKKRNIDQTN